MTQHTLARKRDDLQPRWLEKCMKMLKVNYKQTDITYINRKTHSKMTTGNLLQGVVGTTLYQANSWIMVS